MLQKASTEVTVRKRITVKQLAEMGGVSRRTAYRWANGGLLTVLRVGAKGRGRKMLVFEEEAIAFLMSQEVQAAPDVGPLKFIKS
jgi:predicted site-specific integrase-resolvase